MYQRIWVKLLLVVSFVVVLYGASASQPQARQSHQIAVTENDVRQLTDGQPETSIELQQNSSIMVQTSSGLKRIPVSITWRGYSVDSGEVDKGGRHSERVLRYELKSADGSYSWNLASDFPLFNFRLFNVQGRNYLVWTRSTDICIAEVSDPRPWEDAARAYFNYKHNNGLDLLIVSPRGIVYTDRGERAVFYVKGSWRGLITIVDLSKNVEGQLEMKVRSSDEKKEYTFAQDGNDWHVVNVE